MSCVNVELTVKSSPIVVTVSNIGNDADVGLTKVENNTPTISTNCIHQTPEITLETQASAMNLSFSDLTTAVAVELTKIRNIISEFAFSKVCSLAEILSCFGKGYWVTNCGWSNIEVWRN